jgi:hypothetical protein
MNLDHSMGANQWLNPITGFSEGVMREYAKEKLVTADT